MYLNDYKLFVLRYNFSATRQGAQFREIPADCMRIPQSFHRVENLIISAKNDQF
jgi:hypothetical protein